MVCFRYIVVNTLHKGDNKGDDDDDDDNNNNNNIHVSTGNIKTGPPKYVAGVPTYERQYLVSKIP